MTKWLSVRADAEIQRIIKAVKAQKFVVSAWIGQAVVEKAKRDGLDKSATDEEINGEE